MVGSNLSLLISMLLLGLRLCKIKVTCIDKQKLKEIEKQKSETKLDTLFYSIGDFFV